MTTLTDVRKSVLLDIADVLIPGTDEMPSLRDADTSGEWLERTCAARADLLDELGAILDELVGADLPSVVVALHGNDRARFDVLATFVAGAYYMVPEVRELIGYPGQVRNAAPLDLAAEELGDDLFERAMNYRGSYRPAPD
ncbi:hypothetical protein [Mycobacterium sp. GA-2829]|uniref:hypothetical protein n=1 Tax=Mycobacterium sp. GA-2829 TaxID=1772283 RepID=UPI00073FF252|nr:hypothetical protein [Mycobacterium sp. GA-2829]KUI29308.1 hypothetical protein AU194_20775 [Mycobacterium sp. GA-2829]